MPTPSQIALFLLTAIILIAAYVLWRRYLSRQLLRDRIAELEALRATGAALSATELDITALCHRIAVESSHVIDNRTFQIGVFDDDLYRILFWRIKGDEQQTPRTFNLAEKGGIVGWVRDQRRSLLVRDFVKEQNKMPVAPIYISNDPPRSALFIPLLYGDEVIGVMAAQSAKPNRFTEEDEQRLTVFANQAAAAIAHARLFQMERKQAAHMQAVRHIAMQINALITLEAIFSQTVMLIKETFQFKPVNIFQWNATENKAHIVASSQSNWSARDAQITGGRGLVWEAISSRQTIISNNTSKDGRFQPYTDEKALIRSEINVPIIVGNAVWGVLNVQSSRVGVFAEPEKIALEALGEELAIGIVNRELYKEAAARALMEQELNVARSIQSSLIPNGRPSIPGCDIASFWQAARQVSGDFYDFLPLRDGKWGIVIADVADKGVPAALFMALSRTIIRTVAFNRVCPSDVLIRSNEIIDRETASDLFVTTFYAVWDADSGTLTYANGGHNPPLLLHANGEISLLKGKGMALGVLPDITIAQQKISLHAGDVLLFYTDGVTEAMDENLNEFGLKRLEMAGKTAVSQDAPAILDAITDAIAVHTGATAQFDDITLVVMKVL